MEKAEDWKGVDEKEVDEKEVDFVCFLSFNKIARVEIKKDRKMTTFLLTNFNSNKLYCYFILLFFLPSSASTQLKVPS